MADDSHNHSAAMHHASNGLYTAVLPAYNHSHSMVSLENYPAQAIQDPLSDLFDNLMRRIATAKDRDAALDELIAFARARVAEKTRQTLADEQRETHEMRWSGPHRLEMFNTAANVVDVERSLHAAQRFEDEA